MGKKNGGKENKPEGLSPLGAAFREEITSTGFRPDATYNEIILIIDALPPNQRKNAFKGLGKATNDLIGTVSTVFALVDPSIKISAMKDFERAITEIAEKYGFQNELLDLDGIKNSNEPHEPD